MTWSRTLSLVCRLSGGGICIPVRRSQAAGCGLHAVYRHLWISRGRHPCSLQMELVELQCNDELKAKFDNSPPLSFFRDIALPSRNFPKYIVHVQRIVAMLGGTYCYEQLFSKMKHITSLLRSLLSDLHVNDILLLSSSSIEPDIDTLLHGKQHQPSHWFACFAKKLQPHFCDFVCDSGPRAAPESLIWPSLWKGCPPLLYTMNIHLNQRRQCYVHAIKTFVPAIRIHILSGGIHPIRLLQS